MTPKVTSRPPRAESRATESHFLAGAGLSPPSACSAAFQNCLWMVTCVWAFRLWPFGTGASMGIVLCLSRHCLLAVGKAATSSSAQNCVWELCFRTPPWQCHLPLDLTPMVRLWALSWCCHGWDLCVPWEGTKVLSRERAVDSWGVQGRLGTSLHDSPQRSLSPGGHTLCGPFPRCARVDLYDQWN